MTPEERAAEQRRDSDPMPTCGRCGKPGEHRMCPYEAEIHNEEVPCTCCENGLAECLADI